MAGHAPPATDEELGAGGCLDVLEVLDAGVFGVGPEAVLLVVDGAENVVTNTLYGQYTGYTAQAEFDGVDGEIAGLEGIGKGNPDKVAK